MSSVGSYAGRRSNVAPTAVLKRATSPENAKTHISTVSKSVEKPKRCAVTLASSAATLLLLVRRIGLVHSKSSSLATVSERRKK